MAESDEQVLEEFDEAVNMSRKELEEWLETEESKSVGQGSGESKGHESGRRIIAKESCRRFEASKPGHRFQERYHRRQESEHGWRDPRRLFYLGGGLIIAVGILLLGVLPGPATLTFFVGLGMIAGEFRPVARLLDCAEVRVRKLGRWVKGTWRSSAAGKALLVSVAAICVAALLYVAYFLLFSG